MATSLRQVVHKNLECPVCLSFFKEPKNLTCSHTFCKGSLETLLESRGKLLCPTCREETSVPGGDVGRLQSNITVRSLVEDVETQGQTEALTSHNAMCQELEELLNQIKPDEELPRRTAEEGKRIGFRSQGSEGLKLGQLIQKKSKWVLRTEARLPAGKSMSGMIISPNNEMAVGCPQGGIVIYSSDGTIQETILKYVKVIALHFMPDVGYVVRDTRHNRISLYTELCDKLDITFETWGYEQGGDGGLTVGKDGLIFIGYNACQKIQVFKPEGGKAIREITCKRFFPWHLSAMTSSQAIVVQSICSVSYQHQVRVINDVSGAIIHSISKYGYIPYPAVCQDDSVIIAWVKRDQCLLSIVKYTKELKYIRNILTDFRMTEYPVNNCLQAFKTGEIAFYNNDRVYIFHETWE